MKKIMFNDKYGLTEAVLSGRKTQTRRVCKHQRPDESYEIVFPVLGADDYDEQGNCKAALYGAFGWRNEEGDFTGWNIPKYKVGEVVAIAQRYLDFYDKRNCVNLYDEMPKQSGWNNKLFVRADLMPHHIRITDVRVERLQDISGEDCLKEGILMTDINPVIPHCDFAYDYPNSTKEFYSPKGAYADLIDCISGKGTWKSNPWVFVYDFELETTI